MKKFLSLALALVMCLSLVTISAGAKDFTDDSKITYGEAVDVISELGIVDGYTTGDFRPTDTLTRGAAAKIIANLRLGPTAADALGTSTAPFKDVPVSNVFAGYIAYCSAEGIINGYGDGFFRPGNTVTGFQFLKMLLGALGYDSTIEQFTGTNWSVKVASLAMDNKLTDGNDSFVGTKAMTREEACLYAYNTLKATLVDYNDKGTNIDLGNGIVINTGASKAEVVTSTVASEQNISNKQVANSTAYTVEFAEKFFPKLVLTTTDTDEFLRPAETWTYKSNKIGTYAQSADLTYTKEVKLGDIYSDLGLNKAVLAANVTFSLNGNENEAGNDNTSTPVALNTLGLSKGLANKIGGNGVLTEVFYDNDAGTAKITMIYTYGGEVTSVRAATASKDANVTVTPMNAGLGGTYETEDFSIDDPVLYSYSTKVISGATVEGVQNVATAEQITGTLTGYTAGKSVTVGGTTYSFNKAANISTDTLAGAVKNDVVLTLDSYGYVVDVDAEATSTNYAVVLKYSTKGTWDDAKARLLFTDGTTKDVNLKDNVAGLTAGDTNKGTIVSYKINNKDQYELSVLSANTTVGTAGALNYIVKGSSTLTPTGAAVGSSTAAATVANGKTIFLVATKSGDDTTYTAYTGIANVPSVTVKAGQTVAAAAYAKNGTTATVVFVDATDSSKSEITSSNKDVVFVKNSSAPSPSYDSVKGTYYTYDAIVNNEITTIDLNTTYARGLYTNVANDGNGVYSLSADSTVASGTGTDRAANGSVGLNGAYYSYADDCQVFYVNSDGVISTSSVAGISKDATDTVYWKVTDGDVSTIVIVEQAPSNAVTFSAIKYTIDNGAAVSASISADDNITTGNSADATKTVRITDVTVAPGATYTVSGSAVVVANASPVTAANQITITVTAEDGVTTATYTIGFEAAA